VLLVLRVLHSTPLPLGRLPLGPTVQRICAWVDLSPTVCPTASYAQPPTATATGQIPSQIGLLTRLTVLDLDSNELTGTIPTQIGLLRGLLSLNLHDNGLFGTIPQQIGKLTLFLKSLSLSSNNLYGRIPTQIGWLTRLVFLGLLQKRIDWQDSYADWSVDHLDVFGSFQ
jgi:Leucine-rich repeat (LRR) protein